MRFSIAFETSPRDSEEVPTISLAISDLVILPSFTGLAYHFFWFRSCGLPAQLVCISSVYFIYVPGPDYICPRNGLMIWFFLRTCAEKTADVRSKIRTRLRPNLHTCATKFSHTVSVASIRVEMYFLTSGDLRRHLWRFTSARVKIYAGRYASLPHVFHPGTNYSR